MGSNPNAQPAANEPPTEAELFLDDVIKKVAAISSVSADLVEKVNMLGQKFTIEGRYLKAPNDRFYIKLTVLGLPDAKGVMQQVCDGVTFWDFQQFFDSQYFRRLEAKPILEKIRTADIGDDLREKVMEQMGFAGPDVFLAGLRKAVRFNQKEKGDLDGKPVWILTGTWTSREGLLGPNSQPLPAFARLPSYIPSLVKIYLGQEDNWPYKVLLTGQQSSIVMEDTRPIGPDGRRIGSQALIQKPLLTTIELNYTNVKLNGTIADQEFAFQAPPGAQVEDETKRILEGLEQAATMRAAQKKGGDTGKGDDSVIPGAIDIQKPPAIEGEPPAAVPVTPAAPK
ncbi:LolA family protein [Singulisphaera sp. PoT]|uniref:LolA family protein n=1 Tax=Singulisphaera sp. PoT TaxID=3411797 RepID=UPI003BF5CC38